VREYWAFLSFSARQTQGVDGYSTSEASLTSLAVILDASTMTAFGTLSIDRLTALKLAARNVGRLVNVRPQGSFIGFTKRELRRRDVVALIDGQQTEEVCTAGQHFWFQKRTWFEIGDEVTKAEFHKVISEARDHPPSS
jgi:hypothetical protein